MAIRVAESADQKHQVKVYISVFVNLGQFVITISILVKPGSGRESLTRTGTGDLVVRIPARPVDGAANSYLVEYLSRALRIRKNEVVIEKGLTSKHKRVRIHLDQEEFEKKLSAILQ